MTHLFSIAYLSCQTCHAKVHCDECEKRMEEALMRMQGIDRASVKMGPKQVQVEGGIDADTLEEVLEDLGIFLT